MIGGERLDLIFDWDKHVQYFKLSRNVCNGFCSAAPEAAERG